jgi:hypothetical protein
MAHYITTSSYKPIYLEDNRVQHETKIIKEKITGFGNNFDGIIRLSCRL